MKIEKGQYVVVVKDDALSNNWEGYCFKQRVDDNDVVHPETCPRHPKRNTQESYNVRDNKFRFATDEEIQRYDREGFFKITDEPKIVSPKEISNYEIY